MSYRDDDRGLQAKISELGRRLRAVERVARAGSSKGGLSAYELAVQQGFSGSLDEWLASLVGTPGAAAPSSSAVLDIESSPEPLINTDDYGAVNIFELSDDIPSMAAGLSGSPSDFDRLAIRIHDDGTSRSITWDAPWASGGAAPVTATTPGKPSYMEFVWSEADDAWMCVLSVTAP